MLKKYLRSLFKLTHTQSVPKQNNQAISLLDLVPVEKNYMYICPADGVISACFNGCNIPSEDGREPAIFLSDLNNSTGPVTCIMPAVHGWLGAWIRVRKGDKINLWISNKGYKDGYFHFIADEGA